jgi:hypothetical protein
VTDTDDRAAGTLRDEDIRTISPGAPYAQADPTDGVDTSDADGVDATDAIDR